MRRSRVLDLTDQGLASDAELAEAATAGDQRAFGELYRRHAPAAWRVAQSVTGNRHDASDAVADAFTRVFQALPAGRLREGAAFRPYLLQATRNAALDHLRRTGRLRPTDSVEELEGSPGPDGPSDRMMDTLDQSMVATAFLSLPERWRSVLWLTEVEGIPAKEAAEVLGVSPNGVAQLAVRARAGLRERYLQAHLRERVADECRWSVEHLGAYVAGGLPPRDIAKVDQHLAACESCTARRDELEDLGGRLRRAVFPLPAALAAVSLTRFKAAADVAAVVPRPFAGPLGDPATIDRARKPLLMTAVAVAALGFIGLGVVRPAAPGDDLLAAPPRLERRTLPPPVVAIAPASQTTATGDDSGSSTPFAGEILEARGDGGSLPTSAATPASPPGSPAEPAPPGGGRPAGPPPPAPKPVMQVTAHVTPAKLTVGAGDACIGVTVSTTSVGCKPAPPAKAPAVLSITTSGSLLGDTTVGL